MFRLEMLPAAHGDCLWIEYGADRKVWRILIDGGPRNTYPALRERILHLPASERRFDLLVITHIDADHIEGIIRLLQDAEDLECTFERIWFNGKEELNKVPDAVGPSLGAAQGEILSVLIKDFQKRTRKEVLNADFAAGFVAIDRESASLPKVTLDGDCRLTLLSPDYERLIELKDAWDDELKKAGLHEGDEATFRAELGKARGMGRVGPILGAGEVEQPESEIPISDGSNLVSLGGENEEPAGDGEFGTDSSKANGSSIALLLEYPASNPKVRVILAGDAWAEVLEESLRTLAGGDSKRVSVTAFKISHHGSVGNVTEGLLGRIQCQHYFFSTSGAKFRHPHKRAVDLILSEHSGLGKPRLHFNYLTETTDPWNDPEDQAVRGYEAFHPKGVTWTA